MTGMRERLAKAQCKYFVRMWGAPSKYAIREGDHWNGPALFTFDHAYEASTKCREMNLDAILTVLEQPDKGMMAAAMEAYDLEPAGDDYLSVRDAFIAAIRSIRESK